MNKLFLILTLVFVGMTLRMNAETVNSFQTPDFNFPVDVDARARVVLDSALQVGDDKAAVQALSQIALAQSMISKELEPQAVALIDSVTALNSLAPDYQALLFCLEGEFTGQPDYYEKCFELMGSGNKKALQQPIARYEGVLTLGDEYGRRCLPTLYDFLSNRLCVVLRREDAENVKKAWKKFHAKDKDVLPLAYIDSKYQKKNRGELASDIYKRYGKREELGLFICQLGGSMKLEADYLKRYPDSPFSAQIGADLAKKREQTIFLNYPELLFSTDTIKVNVSWVAADSCALRLYRIPKTIELPGEWSRDEISVTQLQLVDRIVAHRNKKQNIDKICFLPPGYGLYVVLPEFFTEDSTFLRMPVSCNDLKSRLLCVSDLRAFDVTSSDSRKVFVVDGHNGAPVEGVEVFVRYSEVAYVQDERMVTDKEGAVTLKPKASLKYTIAKGADNAKYYYSCRSSFRDNNNLPTVEIFTDLAIYRPGETVQWSAVMYEEVGSERQVLKNQKIIMRLRNAEYKYVDSLEVVTDDFGQVSGKFVLPKEGRNGYFNLYAMGDKDSKLGSHGFEVSEYKLPNYYLDMSETERYQRRFGPLKVKGSLLSYSGMPVANQKIRLRIDYNKYFEVTTDDEGRFSKRAWLHCSLEDWIDRWEALVDGYRWTRHLYISADCATEDGDFLNAHTSVTRNPEPTRVFFNAADAYLLEPGQPLTLPISFRSHDSNIKEVQCHYTLTNQKGKRVKSGDFSTASPVFEWSDLPSGKYMMKCTAKGKVKGFKKKQIVLFHAEDEQPPVPLVLWAPVSVQKVTDDGRVHVTYGTSYNSDIYYVAFHAGEELASGWVKAHSGINTLDFQLPASDDNILYLNLYACHDGQLYREELSLVLPKRKPVALRTETFRDKITPGEKEHWSFTLVDADNQPVDGRLMLELYSKAVESLRANTWRFMPPRYRGRPMATRSFSPDYNSWSDRYFKEIPYIAYRENLPDINLWGTSFGRVMRGLPENKLRKSVNGIVLDVTGEPIVGASVTEQGNPDNGTITDLDGYFSLDLLRKGSPVYVNYIGCTPRLVPSSYNMTVYLSEDSQLLEDVVVVGYGVQKKSMLTGSTSGKIAGLNIKNERENSFGAVDYSADDYNADMAESGLGQEATRLGDIKVGLWAPSIKQDSLGHFSIDFDVVNENTTWRLQALAYTSSLMNDMFSAEVLSQRPLMVQPTLPRFLRAGDTTILKANVENALETAQQVKVVLELFDPRTGNNYRTETYQLQMKGKSRETLSIECVAPYEAIFLGVRIRAINEQGDSDGEQQQLPVLPATSEVVQTLPFYIPASQQAFTLQIPQFDLDSSSRITLEYCDNPVALCLETLPTLADADHVTSPGLAHSLYAIVVADQLRDTLSDYSKVIAKLMALQNADGGFAWLDDSRFSPSSVWATRSVVEMMGNLVQLGCMPADAKLHEMIEKALQYIDNDVCVRVKHDGEYLSVDYAYIRQLFGEEYGYASDSAKTVCEKVIAKSVLAAKATWRQRPLDERAFSAMLLARCGQRAEALKILESLRQMAVHSPARGMYWEHLNQYSYYHPVACTALMLQAFADINEPKYASCIEEMRQWLLLEKQTTKWGNYSMASHAVHSLLLSGEKWSDSDSNNKYKISNIKVDGKPLEGDTINYPLSTIRYQLPANSRNIEFAPLGRPSWGALYHCHIVPIEQIKADSLPEIALRKNLWLQRKDEKGEEMWVALSDTSDVELHVGDKIQVRIKVLLKRDFDCLVLTDERAACFEPKDYISGYHWDWRWRNASYYQEVKDTCMKFYIDRLREGVHIFTYECHITNSGTFSAGMATVESQMAPQYTAHTEGQILEVK